MIVGVEEIPQLQPAACSFTGQGSGTAKKFIRVINPDLFTDTLLISDHFFKQMADQMGYVELKHETKLLMELQERFNELAPTIHSLLSELASIGQRLDSLSALETDLTGLATTMESIVGVAKSSKSTAKSDTSQYTAGISSTSSKSATVTNLFD